MYRFPPLVHPVVPGSVSLLVVEFVFVVVVAVVDITVVFGEDTVVSC